MPQPVQWLPQIPTVLLGRSRQYEAGRQKIAGFDLDGTLISTKSGRVYAKDKNDWKWWHPSVPEKIVQLHNDGYGIVIFSNQNGLNTSQRVREFKLKIQDILAQISVPVLVLAALEKDVYRKPMTGMWQWLSAEGNEGVAIDKEKSFFVGDAAGRPTAWKHKERKDHSTVDRKFAANVGIDFHTPDEFFLQENKAHFSWGEFEPRRHVSRNPPLPKLGDHPEVIVFVGFPACGKTTFAKRHLIPKGFVHVNQDTLKTKEKCVAACKTALAEKKPVVIDNTNPEKATRALYIKAAKDAGVPVRCFNFTGGEDLARHNNYYRALHPSTEDAGEKRELLSDMVFRTFKSKYQVPELSEGFDEVKDIDFVFEGSSDDEKAWCLWWI